MAAIRGSSSNLPFLSIHNAVIIAEAATTMGIAISIPIPPYKESAIVLIGGETGTEALYASMPILQDPDKEAAVITTTLRVASYVQFEP
jgi:hypothetical protein